MQLFQTDPAEAELIDAERGNGGPFEVAYRVQIATGPTEDIRLLNIADK